MVTADPEHKCLKIIDFGLAKKYDPKKEVKDMMGTPEFMGEEIIFFTHVRIISAFSPL